MYLLRSLFVISACGCMTAGSKDASCTDSDGVCTCNTGYTGSKCDSCADGYYMDMDDDKCKGMFPLLLIYSFNIFHPTDSIVQGVAVYDKCLCCFTLTKSHLKLKVDF